MFAAIFRHQNVDGSSTAPQNPPALKNLVSQKSGTPEVTARLMKPEDIETVFALIEAEDWNMTRQKLTVLQQHCPNVTYVLVTEKDEIVATFGIMETFPGEYVLANLVVTPSLRGKGLGRRIIKEFSRRLVPYTCLTLTAVPEALDFYITIGLPKLDPPDDQVISHLTVDAKLLEEKLTALAGEVESIQVTALEKTRLQDLIAYDSAARGYDSSEHTSVVAECSRVVIAEDKSTKKIVGWAGPFLRKNTIVFDGVFADSDAIALALIRESLAQFPGVSDIKIHTRVSRPLLRELGKVTTAYDYVVFAIGPSARKPNEKAYCITDSDYTV